MMPTTDEEIREYLLDLQPGDKVIETGQSMMIGKTGVVYRSDNPGRTFGSLCVKWENDMGTSVTWGTRLVVDTFQGHTTPPT